MNGFIHYFFGEISSINTTKISPSSEEELKKILDASLPKLIEKAESAAGSVSEAEVLCQQWTENVNEKDIGLISIPLSKVSSRYEKYSHLVCWVYYNWATGGRISRSAHAVILSAKQWEEVGYDPFSIKGFSKSSVLFNNIKKMPDLYNDRDSYMLNFQRYILAEDSQSKSDLVLFKYDVDLISIRHFLNSLEPRVRKNLSFWVGAFGINENYRDLFNIGQLKKHELSVNGSYLVKNLIDNESHQSFSIKLPLGDVDERVIDNRIKNSNLEKIKKFEAAPIVSNKKRPTKYVVFLILFFLFLLVFIVSVLLSGSNTYDSWLANVKNNEKNIQELIIDGINIRQSAQVSSKQIMTIDNNLTRLSRELESNVAQLSSRSEGIIAVTEALKAIYTLRNIEWPSEIKRQWNYNKNLERLYIYQKEKFLEYAEENSVEKQKKLMDYIDESYSLELPGFVNPYLSEMKRSITLHESSASLNDIINSWNPKGSNRHFYEVSNRLYEYKDSFGSYHSNKIEEFEDGFYKKYADNLIINFSNEYSEIRSNPEDLLNSDIFLVYKIDLDFVPSEYHNLVPILDYKRFENDLKNSVFVKIINRKGFFNLNLFDGKCINKPIHDLETSLYGTICVSVEKENKPKLGSSKAVSLDFRSIKVFELLDEKDYVSKLEVNIKWPVLKNYIRQ